MRLVILFLVVVLATSAPPGWCLGEPVDGVGESDETPVDERYPWIESGEHPNGFVPAPGITSMEVVP